MRRRCAGTVGAVLGLGLLLLAPGGSLAESHEGLPDVATPHFAFFNDLDTNLNDALLTAGTARRFEKPEAFHEGAAASCFEELPPAVRAGWDQAVDYYAEIISPADFDDREQFLVRMDLAGFDEKVEDAAARQFVDIASGLRAAANRGYVACRWADQEAANGSWIDEAESLLAVHEEGIARQLEALYQKAWDDLPIPVDVVETVSWSGANSVILDGAGGHLLISEEYRGPAALEIIFHEASHLLMGRNDPVWRALADAARDLGVPEPNGLWHVVLFYTTGETVRRSLETAGEPAYTPMIYEIYGRSPWGRYEEAVEGVWPAYLDGEKTLAEAAADLVRAIDESGEAE